MQVQVKAVSLLHSTRGTWSKMESGWEVRSGVQDLGMAVVRFYLKCIGKSVKLFKQRRNVVRFFFHSCNSVEADGNWGKAGGRRGHLGLTHLWAFPAGLHS